MSFKLTEDGIGLLNYTILTSDTDSFYRSRLSLYQAMVQEIAGLHASERGLGLDTLLKEGKTWVIARSRMEIFHYGVWKDDIQVETWAQDPVGLNCPRMVRAKNIKDNRPLFFANTKWALIDVNKGRPLRPTEAVKALSPLKKELQIDQTLPNNTEIVEKLDKILGTYNPRILYLDTDYNHHVNNRTYINWILEALPVHFLDMYKPNLIDVRWIRQTYRDDSLEVIIKANDNDECSKENPLLFFEIYRIKDSSTKELVFDAFTTWKKREYFY